MGMAFVIVWGIALVVIAILLVILMVTLQQNTQSEQQVVQEPESVFVPFKESLLFAVDPDAK